MQKTSSRQLKPLGAPVAETIAVAKRDTKAGDEIDEIGGYKVYGTIERAEVARTEQLLPFGLAKGARLLVDLPKGHPVSYADVTLNASCFTVMLRFGLVCSNLLLYRNLVDWDLYIFFGKSSNNVLPGAPTSEVLLVRAFARY